MRSTDVFSGRHPREDDVSSWRNRWLFEGVGRNEITKNPSNRGIKKVKLLIH